MLHHVWRSNRSGHSFWANQIRALQDFTRTQTYTYPLGNSIFWRFLYFAFQLKINCADPLPASWKCDGEPDDKLTHHIIPSLAPHYQVYKPRELSWYIRIKNVARSSLQLGSVPTRPSFMSVDGNFFVGQWLIHKWDPGVGLLLFDLWDSNLKTMWQPQLWQSL